jgi:hypothetical protein
MPGHAWNVAASILRDACYDGPYGNPWDFGWVGYLNPTEEPDIGIEVVGPLLVDERRAMSLAKAWGDPNSTPNQQKVEATILSWQKYGDQPLQTVAWGLTQNFRHLPSTEMVDLARMAVFSLFESRSLELRQGDSADASDHRFALD